MRSVRSALVFVSALIVIAQTLVARYNPGGDLSETERIKATARRVGLDVPDDFDPLAPGELFRIKGGKKGGDGSS